MIAALAVRAAAAATTVLVAKAVVETTTVRHVTAALISDQMTVAAPMSEIVLAGVETTTVMLGETTVMLGEVQ